MIYLIQGIFFQDQHFMHVGQDGGIVWRIGNGVAAFAYAGLIKSDTDPIHSHFIGRMHDIFGCSELTDILVTETELHFMKHYAGRESPVCYEFRKQTDGTWLGKYRGPMGSFTSRCVLTPVPESFFMPGEDAV